MSLRVLRTRLGRLTPKGEAAGPHYPAQYLEVLLWIACVYQRELPAWAEADRDEATVLLNNAIANGKGDDPLLVHHCHSQLHAMKQWRARMEAGDTSAEWPWQDLAGELRRVLHLPRPDTCVNLRT
jgi:hypothetical protein